MSTVNRPDLILIRSRLGLSTSTHHATGTSRAHGMHARICAKCDARFRFPPPPIVLATRSIASEDFFVCLCSLCGPLRHVSHGSLGSPRLCDPTGHNATPHYFHRSGLRQCATCHSYCYIHCHAGLHGFCTLHWQQQLVALSGLLLLVAGLLFLAFLLLLLLFSAWCLLLVRCTLSLTIFSSDILVSRMYCAWPIARLLARAAASYQQS